MNVSLSNFNAVNMFINQQVEIIIMKPKIPPNKIPNSLNVFFFDLYFSKKKLMKI